MKITLKDGSVKNTQKQNLLLKLQRISVRDWPELLQQEKSMERS